MCSSCSRYWPFLPSPMGCLLHACGCRTVLARLDFSNLLRVLHATQPGCTRANMWQTMHYTMPACARVLSCTLALLPVPQVLPSTCDGRRARPKSRTGRRQGRPCTRTGVWRAARSIARDHTAPCAPWFPPLRLLRAVPRCRHPLPLELLLQSRFVGF